MDYPVRPPDDPKIIGGGRLRRGVDDATDEFRVPIRSMDRQAATRSGDGVKEQHRGVLDATLSMTSVDDAALVLSGRELPPGFERWRVVLEPMTERPTDPGEWAGALVLIERGLVEAVCDAGGHRTFVEGDLLVLGWLPICLLRNPAPEEARLLAVRRRARLPTEPYLHVLHPDERRVRWTDS